MLNTLKELCLLNGVSGDEKSVREYIISKIDGFCDWRVDNLGNIIAYKKGKSEPKNKIMLDAHTDEVGFIITNITEKGFLKFSTVGGIDTAALINRQVLIGENVKGVISAKPVHLISADERKKLPSADSLYIDIGALSKEEAEKTVKLGDCGVICGEFLENADCFIAKAIDDRTGCAVLIDLIRNYDEYSFYASFSVQEEVGLRGAKVSTYAINPDFAIVLESTTAADIADAPPEKMVCSLGKGPAISFMDKATVYDRALYNRALNSGIKCQAKSMVAGGNNAGAVHLSREGVRTVAISRPTRYLHTASTVANKDDLFNVRKLAEYMLNSIASGEIK